MSNRASLNTIKKFCRDGWRSRSQEPEMYPTVTVVQPTDPSAHYQAGATPGMLCTGPLSPDMTLVKLKLTLVVLLI